MGLVKAWLADHQIDVQTVGDEVLTFSSPSLTEGEHVLISMFRSTVDNKVIINLVDPTSTEPGTSEIFTGLDDLRLSGARIYHNDHPLRKERT